MPEAEGKPGMVISERTVAIISIGAPQQRAADEREQREGRRQGPPVGEAWRRRAGRLEVAPAVTATGPIAFGPAGPDVKLSCG